MAMMATDESVIMSTSENEALAALDYLRRYGWLKANFETNEGEGPACLQALKTRKGIISERTLDAIKAVAYEQYRDRYGHGEPDCILHFNDHLDTTFEDVERVLEKAAVRLAEEV